MRGNLDCVSFVPQRVSDHLIELLLEVSFELLDGLVVFFEFEMPPISFNIVGETIRPGEFPAIVAVHGYSYGYII